MCGFCRPAADPRPARFSFGTTIVAARGLGPSYDGRPMRLLDGAVVVGWLVLSFLVGLYFSRRASVSADDFFVSDRSLPWWVVGTSMVATTFAADTPLAVSGYVASGGIADNWAWWFSGAGAIATVFLFARLWRRAHVVTEAELCELRYGGRASRYLRAIKAVWFGVFMNLLVIAWVMRAMVKVVQVVLDVPEGAELLGVSTTTAIVLGLFVLAVIYTSASGLYGVVATDVLQFPLAMLGSVLLAVLAWREVGGHAGLLAGFEAHGFDWHSTTELLPLDDPDPTGRTSRFVVLMGVMWWASRTLDGGSYLAQRLSAARDENHALWGYLWFAMANLCLRPWPWIVVGLCGMAMFGPQQDPETYYPLVMAKVVPVGLFGLLVASFLAAFMSTIDTQLHWGASLLINDVYRRFVAPSRSEQHMVRASRVAVLALAVGGALASFVVHDIRAAWELAIAVTAGLGAVHAARWYWWRTNAYSEFSALIVAGLGTAMIRLLKDAEPTLSWLSFPFDAALIVAFSVPVWVGVTLWTRPGDRQHLRAFYERVRPGGRGWRAVAGDLPGFEHDGPGWHTLLGIVGGWAALYGLLLGLGALITARWWQATGWGVAALLGGALCARQVVNETSRVGAPQGGMGRMRGGGSR